MQGDCLERMKEIPSGSIDAIICDPPYGTMKGAELDGWEGGKTDWDTCIDHKAMLAECNRVLRTNGALVLFSQDPYTAKLITEQHGNLPFSYRMTWLKDHFANSLIAKKAPVNYTEDICVFFKRHDALNQNPLAAVVRDAQEKSGKYWNGKLAELYVKNGWSKSFNNAKAVLKHYLNWDYVQFSALSSEQYARVSQLIDLPSLNEMQEMHREYRSSSPKTFNLPEGKKYKSNVLKYKKDYTGFHPTQKPVALLEDLIRTYTNEGNTVLDFTCGSGSTGVAAKNLNRSFIGIELDKSYFNIAKERINA
ncbi:putative DNA methylase [Pseudoalteromonas phage PHS3]|nr:putative DNA methylase [Pseudoalteromonas phage PHS3]